jgi:hypothetical protein
MKRAALAVGIAALACAQPLETRLAAARTAADVDAIVGKDPTCTEAGGGFRSCTWRPPSFSRTDCIGYADCGSPRKKPEPRAITCRVDPDDRISDCQVGAGAP